VSNHLLSLRIAADTLRSYQGVDAVQAANWLWQNNTFEDGKFLAKKQCIYRRQNSTIVSLCNGSARNRTVNRAEVRRGIEQLIKDCNIDEKGFSGIHVVNNLTFAAYGVFGGKNIKKPADTPTKRNPLLKRATCSNNWVDGSVREDCDQPEGHEIDDDGNCPPVDMDKTECRSYCETSRSGFLGLETQFDNSAGQLRTPGADVQLGESVEYSVSHGFDASAAGEYGEAISAGVGYSCKLANSTQRLAMAEVLTRSNQFPPRRPLELRCQSE
jgi:hypothetical protein